MWQDLVFTSGSVLLLLTLVPTILDSSRSVPRWTSVPTALILVVFGLTYLTMDFLGAALTCFGTFAAWTAIAVWRN